MSFFRRRIRLPGFLDSRISAEEKIDSEFEHHLAECVDFLVQRGMREADARREALIRFGDRRRYRGECEHEFREEERRENRAGFFTSLSQDLRFAFRQLAKHPGFALVAILTLGLGIGANTTLFALVNRVLFHPLPFPDSEQLTVVWDVQPGYSGRPKVSVPEFQDWRREGSHFQALVAQAPAGANLRSEGMVERVSIMTLAGDYLGFLGLDPALGRGFTPQELEASEPVAMVSEAFWQSRFGGSREVLGSTIELDGEIHTVIGVMPGAAHRISSLSTMAWIPLSQARLATPRGVHFLNVFGRLNSGVSGDAARDQTEAMAAALRESNGTDHGIRLQSLEEFLVGRARLGLWVLLSAGMAVLLIICGNLASLFLARSAAREQEFAVRLSLGAGEGRLGRQLLTETSLVGLLGGGLGLLLSAAFTRLLMALSPNVAALGVESWMDARVVGFTLLVALGAGLAFGLTPVQGLRKSQLASVLRETEGSRGGGGIYALRKRRRMVAGQLAFSMMLLATSTLLVRSLVNMAKEDPGLDREGILAFRLALPAGAYPDAEATNLFYRRLLERLDGLPGVSSSTTVNELPFTGAGSNGGFRIPGREWPEGERPYVYKRVVGAEYFETLGIPIIRGRGFSETDGAESPLVAVISERMAREHWPGSDPLGTLANVWGGEAEIVGVVGEVKHEGFGIEPRSGTAYVPMAQIVERQNVWIVLKTVGDPQGLVEPARDVVRAMDSGLPLFSVTTMEELVERTLANGRITTGIFLSMGLLGLLLSSVGVFGVTAYSVQRRTREIGVRMAMGAGGGRMMRMVLREEIPVLGKGLGLGLLLALAVTRVMSAGLVRVSPFDPMAFGATLTILGGIGLLAIYLPARKAARVDPISALRSE